MSNENSVGEIQIDIKDCVKAVIKRWYVVAIAMFAGLILAFIFGVLGHQQAYSSSIKIYVNNRVVESDGWTQSDISASRSLVEEYLVVLKSRPTMDKVCEQVKEKYGYSIDSKTLKGLVSGNSVNETTILQITVTTGDPEASKNIVNSIADVFPTEVESIFDASSAKVFEHAVDSTPIDPGYFGKLLIGAFIGALLACIYAVIMGVFINDTIESDDWISSRYENKIPLLGVIPDENYEMSGRYGSYRKSYTSQSPNSKPDSSKSNTKQGRQ